MESVGINLGYLLIQLLVMGVYIGIMSLTLRSLYHREMEPIVKIIWAVVIFSIPVLGIVAFWIIVPGNHPARH